VTAQAFGTPLTTPRRTAAGSRDRLLDAARVLFAEAGFDGFSMAEVALRAGASRPAVYRMFPDRAALLAAVVNRDADDLVGRLYRALPAEAPLDSLIEQALVVFVDFAAERRREYLVLFGQAGRVHPEVASLLQGLRARLAAFYVPAFRDAALRAAIPQPSDAQARLTAFAIMSMCEGVMQSWLEDDHPSSSDELVRLLKGMVMRSLQP